MSGWDDVAAGLAAAAADLRESAERDEAAGLIPHCEGEARRTAADILEDWRDGEEGTR